MPQDLVDVAIIGGGPAGSTCASLLRKYAPELRVTLVERETFPRDHVGESQLPAIGKVLHEMGVWDKVEAAESQIATLNAELAKLDKALADPLLFTRDPAKGSAVSKKRADAARKLEAAEKGWMAAQEEYDMALAAD